MSRHFILAVFLILALAVRATDTRHAASLRYATAADTVAVRPVTAAWTLEYGTAHTTDTYLSPLHYDGWHLGFDYNRLQAPRLHPGRLTMQLDTRLTLDRTLNPARNATMWGLMLRLEWGMMRRWAQVGGLPLTLAAGGSIAGEGGVLYSARNGNNPASAKGAVTLNVTGLAAYRLNIKGLPVTLLYRPSLPLAGAFFSPQYGELYYEIYLGDRQGLVHAAWPGSYFCLDNQLTADIPVGVATNIRVGYTGRVFSSKACDIVTRQFTHALTIGISGDWVSFAGGTRGTPRHYVTHYAY